MTYEELEKKYNHLFERVKRLRGWQKEYDIYHGSMERETKKRIERDVDNLIKQETDLQKRKQKELF